MQEFFQKVTKRQLQKRQENTKLNSFGSPSPFSGNEEVDVPKLTKSSRTWFERKNSAWLKCQKAMGFWDAVYRVLIVPAHFTKKPYLFPTGQGIYNLGCSQILREARS